MVQKRKCVYTIKIFALEETVFIFLVFRGVLILFNKEYYRTLDLIESLALLGICYQKITKYDKALESVIEAIIISHKYGIVTPIVLLGTDIIFLLRKIISKVQRASIYKYIDQEFLLKLLLLARIRSSVYKGFFYNQKEKYVKLSFRQKYILELLTCHYTYKEIGKNANIKITTVREHISKIYKKLGVSNSEDAILKAMELGLLQKN